jgi:hypothetical protein
MEFIITIARLICIAILPNSIFRYSNRCDLGFEDTSRTEKALKGLEGKRLMYRQPDRTAHA